jgi:ElaB/YqjD/DUF883 family membrane-anchored ribosome-binding protein
LELQVAALSEAREQLLVDLAKLAETAKDAQDLRARLEAELDVAESRVRERDAVLRQKDVVIESFEVI